MNFSQTTTALKRDNLESELKSDRYSRKMYLFQYSSPSLESQLKSDRYSRKKPILQYSSPSLES